MLHFISFFSLMCLLFCSTDISASRAQQLRAAREAAVRAPVEAEAARLRAALAREDAAKEATRLEAERMLAERTAAHAAEMERLQALIASQAREIECLGAEVRTFTGGGSTHMGADDRRIEDFVADAVPAAAAIPERDGDE